MFDFQGIVLSWWNTKAAQQVWFVPLPSASKTMQSSWSPACWSWANKTLPAGVDVWREGECALQFPKSTNRNQIFLSLQLYAIAEWFFLTSNKAIEPEQPQLFKHQLILKHSGSVSGLFLMTIVRHSVSEMIINSSSLLQMSLANTFLMRSKN